MSRRVHLPISCGRTFKRVPRIVTVGPVYTNINIYVCVDIYPKGPTYCYGGDTSLDHNSNS